jgi:G3E family GTPase
MPSITETPVHIITGFLGAGKTSLVNDLVRAPELAGSAVLINEFGEISIDHDLVAEVEADAVVTTTGCLCCTAESDVVSALATLEARGRTFDRVLVETTGLADPAPVVNSLLSMPSEPGRPDYRLASVVTLFDIIHGDLALDEHLEAVKQVALADVVVLTKTDLAEDPATRRDIRVSVERIRSLNPAVRVLDRSKDLSALIAHLASKRAYDTAGLGADALNWLAAEAVLGHTHGGHDRATDDPNRHDDRVRAHVLTLDTPIEPKKLNMFLQMLGLSSGPKVLRLKGIVALADDPERPLVVHGVQHKIAPVERLDVWPSADRRTRIVIIGRDLKVQIVERMLASLVEPPRKIG